MNDDDLRALQIVANYDSQAAIFANDARFATEPESISALRRELQKRGHLAEKTGVPKT